MTKHILSNEMAASQFSSGLKAGLQQYASFDFDTLFDVNNAPTSDVLDGLGPSVNEALFAWKDLIDVDAKSIEDVAEAFTALDTSVARGLMGAGG